MHTDANAIAGLLAATFGRDVTAEQRVCQSCRTRSAVGAHRLYRGAGLVLRCPACGEVAACISARDRLQLMTMYGRWLFTESSSP